MKVVKCSLTPTRLWALISGGNELGHLGNDLVSIGSDLVSGGNKLIRGGYDQRHFYGRDGCITEYHPHRNGI